MRTLTKQTQRAVDQWAPEQLGLSLDVLMATAGHAVFSEVYHLVESTCAQRVVIFVGAGNNGGDGWVVSRLLRARGVPVSVFEVTAPSEDTVAYRAKVAACACGVSMDRAPFPETARYIVVDALLGTGFDRSRPLSEEMVAAIEQVNAMRDQGAIVVSIDIPSGVDANTGLCSHPVVTADHTVTFLAPKLGMVTWPGLGQVGSVHIKGLGIPDALWQKVVDGASVAAQQRPVITRGDDEWGDIVPRRTMDQHKGQSGRVLILAGSLDSPGACVLTTCAAARSGVGLTYVAADGVLMTPLLSHVPDAVLRTLPSDMADDIPAFIAEWCTSCDVAVVGPGSGNQARTRALAVHALAHTKHVVLDADALNVFVGDLDDLARLAKEREARGASPPVLTPHPGEFARLFPDLMDLPRHEAAAEAAQRIGAVILLKGAATVVASPDPSEPIYVNQTGNSGLARGGSGDLLAGLIGSLIAQTQDPLHATELACYIHGKAADLAVHLQGQTETTHDWTKWLQQLPQALRAVGFK